MNGVGGPKYKPRVNLVTAKNRKDLNTAVTKMEDGVYGMVGIKCSDGESWVISLVGKGFKGHGGVAFITTAIVLPEMGLSSIKGYTLTGGFGGVGGQIVKENGQQKIAFTSGTFKAEGEHKEATFKDRQSFAQYFNFSPEGSEDPNSYGELYGNYSKIDRLGQGANGYVSVAAKEFKQKQEQEAKRDQVLTEQSQCCNNKGLCQIF